MLTYMYEGWQFFTDEALDLKASKIDFSQTNNVYLFRGGLDQTTVAHRLTEGTLKGITQSFRAIFEEDKDTLDPLLLEMIKSKPIVAVNLDAFESYGLNTELSILASVIKYINWNYEKRMNTKVVNVLGLGDVGATLSIGLKLLGGQSIDTLGIFDLNKDQVSRWEMELNQVILNQDIRVVPVDLENLFNCDVFLFCASKYIPAIGEQVKDVRMAQYETNAELIAYYAKKAREENFKGQFVVVSDPVDLLCQKVYVASNLNNEGIMDYKGLLPDQIRGYGLGVMHGRAIYHAKRMGMTYAQNGRVFGPHGSGLVVADDITNYNSEASIILTQAVVKANLEMRAIGFKPYVAPALSSGAISIVSLLEGKWHESATFLNGVFFGMRNRWTPWGTEIEEVLLPVALIDRIEKTHKDLEATWLALNS